MAILGLVCLGWFLSCAISDLRERALDDAFITYNYARSVAEGGGIRFNATDPDPTDGASSLLHLAVTAVAIKLGFDPLVSTRAVGLTLFLAVPLILGPVVARVTRVPLGVGLLCAAAAWTGLALAPETGWHLAAGMETILFVFVHVAAACWAVWFALAPGRPGIAAAAIGPLVLTLLTTARPEGLLLAGAYLMLVPILRSGMASPVSGSGFGRRWIVVAVAFALMAGAVLAWKVWYFGHLLPNAYYVKSRSGVFGTASDLLPGARFVLVFLVMRYIPLAILVGVWAAVLGVSVRARSLAGVVLLPVLGVVLLYARAIHETAGAFRYEYPYLVTLYGCVALLFGVQWQRSRVAFGWMLALGVSCVPALAPLPLMQQSLRAPWSMAVEWTRHERVGDALALLGRDLGETRLGQNATILLGGAGQVPYYSRFKAIDWVGLNTTYLSGRYPLTIAQVWEYVDAERPDVIYSVLPPAAAGARDRHSDPGFLSPSVRSTLDGRGSELMRRWDPDRVAEMFYREMQYVRDYYEFGAAYGLPSDWALMAYVRKDSPHRDVLQRVLKASRRADWQLDLTQHYRVDPRALH